MTRRKLSVPRPEAPTLAFDLRRSRRAQDPWLDHRAHPPPRSTRAQRSSISSALEQPLTAIHENPRITPRTPFMRKPRFSTLHANDGTELRLRTDRFQCRRATQVPGLGLSLFDMRDKFWTDWNDGTPPIQTPSERRDTEEFLTPTSRNRKRAETQDVRYEMLQMAGDATGKVQLERIGRHGFTSEDLSRVVYDKFRDQDLPDFLDYIGLERKGGLDRIKEIWSPEKYLWFFLLIGSVLFNISYLLAMDWVMFNAFMKEIITEVETVSISNITQVLSVFTPELASSEQTMDIAKNVKDSQTRWWLLHVAAVVAVWEVAWIFVKAVHTIYIWWLFCFGGSEYKSFHAIMYFFQKLLPQCSTFSAIKMMARVHPSLIYNEYLYFVYESPWRASWVGLVAVSVYFFLKCVACAMAALGAFTIKVLAVGIKLLNTQYSVLYRIGSIAALMNQCMGCVIIEVVLQDRLFLFVFGGQQAMYQDRGIAYKNVYECRMAKQIWSEFWEKGRRLQAIVLIATFDHYDLQRLLIECQSEDFYNVDLGSSCGSPRESIIPIEAVDPDDDFDADEEDPDYDIIPRPDARPDADVPADPQLAPPQAASRSADKEGCRVSFRPPEDEENDTQAPSEHREESRSSSCAGPSSMRDVDAPWEAGEETSRDSFHLEGHMYTTDSFSGSSTASRGMRAVTTALQHELDWRDAC